MPHPASRWCLLLVILSALLLEACSSGPSTRRPRATPESRVNTAPPASAGVHQVRRGDTLYGIARQHGLDYRQLAKLNGIKAPYRIYPGQKLRLGADSGPRASTSANKRRPRPSRVRSPPPPQPRNAAVKPVAPTPPPTDPVAAPVKPAATTSKPPKPAAGSNSGWQWPTDGNVLRSFQANDPARQGLKIGGQAGQPVRASRAGQVVYSGTGLVGYGELVIIKHDGGYLTAYGHNRKRLVAEGDQVKRGQVIAEMGRSGTDREMLHFEIRVAGKPTDPARLLPAR